MTARSFLIVLSPTDTPHILKPDRILLRIDVGALTFMAFTKFGVPVMVGTLVVARGWLYFRDAFA